MSRILEKYYPSSLIDQIAEKESYRKEVYRPIYHMHKWWAQRLGSVFRALIIGAIGKDESIYNSFYDDIDFKGKIVLDPFMGSGTTVGEALKLGCKAIGNDINPVSSFIVQQSLRNIDISDLEHTFSELERKTKERIQFYYTKTDPETGERCSVLYFFWVRTIKVPSGSEVPLFSSYIFSKNAYPKNKPQSKIICPNCYSINEARYDTTELNCSSCSFSFNPQEGPVKGSMVTDPATGERHKIIELVRKSGKAPRSRMYAALVLRSNGQKKYLKADDQDLALYEQAKQDYFSSGKTPEEFKISPGHNTSQTLNYNFFNWTELFNYRQLHCLTILLEAINEIESTQIRDQFLTLFSGTLEFNNMFCSFKGEGTGAVRHLFYNHILKPERVPLENSVWGTEKSSGTFSSLYKSRLIKAKEYLNRPFELKVQDGKSQKVYLNKKLNPRFVKDFRTLSSTDNSCLILNSDSSHLEQIPDLSVDAVVTDPPYFDYVHYSELSDFFYAWLKPVLSDRYDFFSQGNSRRKGEVQNRSVTEFAKNLSNVFKECRRVLKDDGVMVFSFHHSRGEGWSAIFKAIHDAGFRIEKTYPVKAEMIVSTPKNQAKSPINLDSLIVCKKLTKSKVTTLNSYMDETVKNYKSIMSEFQLFNRELSNNDKRVIFYSKLIESLSRIDDHSLDFSRLIESVEFVEHQSAED